MARLPALASDRARYHPGMPQARPAPTGGFTLIEMMIVIAVIAILALMAVPAMQETALRKQVREGMELAAMARAGVQAAYAMTGEMPANNAAAGLPPADRIIGNLVKQVTVDGGAITLTYGNNASRALLDKRLTLRPAVVTGQPGVPIAWICHTIAVPQGMDIKGRDVTDIPDKYLPLECRGPSR